EVDDKDGEPDRRLARGHGQHEHREDLAGEVVQEGTEGHQVEVHGEQNELDRHQNDDDVLAIEEDAEHAQHEQDRADDDVVFDADHSVTPLPTSGRTLTVASSGRRAIWRATFWPRTSLRWRWVSTIAPIIATSRIMPAASNRKT